MSEAIEILEHLRDNNLANLEMGCYEDGDIERTIIEENKALNTAIAALRAQSAAEDADRLGNCGQGKGVGE